MRISLRCFENRFAFEIFQNLWKLLLSKKYPLYSIKKLPGKVILCIIQMNATKNILHILFEKNPKIKVFFNEIGGQRPQTYQVIFCVILWLQLWILLHQLLTGKHWSWCCNVWTKRPQKYCIIAVRGEGRGQMITWGANHIAVIFK